jgi:hypothetical protein
MLQEVLDLNKDKDKPLQRNRSVYFCMGFSNFWKEPIHKWLKLLRNRFDLKWLRILMSYHHFPNLRELLVGNLLKKLTEGVESMDFKVQDCNCRDPRGTGKCQYGGVSFTKLLVK